MTPVLTPNSIPNWLPGHAMLYVRHVEQGVSLRELAKAEGCHPSTIMRRIRRIEKRRDDPLVDEALGRLRGPDAGQQAGPQTRAARAQPKAGNGTQAGPGKARDATRALRDETMMITDARLQDEARRILRRLSEPGALMILADDMDKALVLRGTVRIAVLDRAVARAFALKDWIQVRHSGRVVSYEISMPGRAALKRLLAQDDDAGHEDAFAAQHRSPRLTDGPDRAQAAGTQGAGTRARVNLHESPLGVLSRRREKDGTLFLGPELVAAGERLREDFELSLLGPRVTQNWDRFLSGSDRSRYNPDQALGGGSDHARDRVAAALADLGPGLGDMVLRCCCFLEGLEAAEKRMGWSARSGKIVLRIALQRLHRHYEERYGGRRPLIG